MNLIKWSGAMSGVMLVLGSLFFGIMVVTAEENANNTIVIDDMRSVNIWEKNAYQNNASIKISPSDPGLKISYDLKKNNSWVGTYQAIDFSMLPDLNKIEFYYTGQGAPNTLELALSYDDGSIFKYKRNSATNASV